MSKRRIVESESISPEYLDVRNWPTVLIDNLKPEAKDIFLRRKNAVEMYMLHEAIQKIKDNTGIDFVSLRRFIRRCLEVDDNGMIWGYRALIPNKQISGYKRSRNTLNGSDKMTGAFSLLLDTFPIIKDTIVKFYFNKDKRSVQDPVMRVKHLHKKFLESCRQVGLTEKDYPFNTINLGKRSLERYVHKLAEESFTQAARRHGEEAASIARSTGIQTLHTPMIVRPLERVQFDGHRIDAIFSITFQTPEGDEITEVMDRLWLLVIIDVATRAVLGYYLSLNKEYSAADVLQCIRNAIVPRTAKKLTISGLKYHAEGGFPSLIASELHWALWDELLYDNGKANLANIVNDRLTQIVGCAVNADPVALPVRRGYIERFFGTLEENGYHRLPNTTGSRPGDPRRKSPEKQAIKFAISYEHLEELTDVLISDYNGTPHEGLNNLSPIEVLKQRLNRGMIPRVMPEEKRNEISFLSMRVQRKVCGSVSEGRRPSVNYEGVEYRNEVLSRSPDFIGVKLDLLINMDDLRVIQAFLPDGGEFGALTATGKWGITPHSLQIRKQINKLRNNKLLHISAADDPIECYQRYLEQNAIKNRSSRNKLANLKRTNETANVSEHISTPEDHVVQKNNIDRSHREVNRTKIFRTITY